MTSKNITSWIYLFDISKTAGQINDIVFTKTLNMPVEWTFKTLASMCVITALGLYCIQGRSTSVGLRFKFKPARLRLRPFSAEQTKPRTESIGFELQLGLRRPVRNLRCPTQTGKKLIHFTTGEVPKRFADDLNHYALV